MPTNGESGVVGLQGCSIHSKIRVDAKLLSGLLLSTLDTLNVASYYGLHSMAMNVNLHSLSFPPHLWIVAQGLAVKTTDLLPLSLIHTPITYTLSRPGLGNKDKRSFRFYVAVQKGKLNI